MDGQDRLHWPEAEAALLHRGDLRHSVLKAFMNVKNTSDRDLIWLVAIHMVFVVSGLIMALTDRFSESAHGKKQDIDRNPAPRKPLRA